MVRGLRRIAIVLVFEEVEILLSSDQLKYAAGMNGLHTFSFLDVSLCHGGWR